MTTAVQRRRGTNTEHATFTGLDGEITVNTTTYTLHVHDGSTVGGIVLAKADGSNISTSSIDINGGTIDGTVIGATTPAAGTFTSITGTSANINGTVTADGLTVENAGGSAKAVIKSTTTAGGQTQYLNASTGTTGFLVGLLGDTSGNGTLFHQDAKDILVYTNGLKRANFGSGGDISFYEDTGTTPKLFWDASAESLGIGTTSPQESIHTTGNIRFGDTAPAEIYTNSSELRLGVDRNDDNVASDITFYVNNSEKVRIDSSGNVDIGGTGVTTKKITVAGGIGTQNGTAADPTLSFYGDADTGLFRAAVDTLGFSTGGSERARIDSSGNLLVGKTASDIATSGVELSSTDRSSFTRASGFPILVNRTTSDGEIINIRKDGTTVGSIGAFGGDLTLGTGITGIHFKDASDAIIPYNVSTGADRNGDIDLGLANNRFKNLYLSGGVYLGGTGAANLLDDYEEGTFTPSAYGTTTTGTATYTVQEGNYTKVGRLVTATFNIAWTDHTGAGTFYISGLPFASFNDLDRRHTSSIHYNQFTVGSGKQIGSLLVANSTNLYFYANDPAGSTNTSLSIQTACGYLAVTITYQTN